LRARARTAGYPCWASRPPRWPAAWRSWTVSGSSPSMSSTSGTHSERLLAAVDRCWPTRVGRHASGGVAVSIGPGSFTGLRIGVSTARPGPGLDCRSPPCPRRRHGRPRCHGRRCPVCPVLQARWQGVRLALSPRRRRTASRMDYLALSARGAWPGVSASRPAGGRGRCRVDSPTRVTCRPAPRALAGMAGRTGATAPIGDSVGAAELAPLYLRPSQAELRHVQPRSVDLMRAGDLDESWRSSVPRSPCRVARRPSSTRSSRTRGALPRRADGVRSSLRLSLEIADEVHVRTSRFTRAPPPRNRPRPAAGLLAEARARDVAWSSSSAPE